MKAGAWLGVVAALLAAGPLGADEGGVTDPALQGTWQVISHKVPGRPTDRPRQMKWVVDGKIIWLEVGKGVKGNLVLKMPANLSGGRSGKLQAAARGVPLTCRLHPNRSPKQIDIGFAGKSISYGIYKVEGDQLTVCMGVTHPYATYGGQTKGEVEKTRPTAFRPECGTLIVLRRVKK